MSRGQPAEKPLEARVAESEARAQAIVIAAVAAHGPAILVPLARAALRGVRDAVAEFCPGEEKESASWWRGVDAELREYGAHAAKWLLRRLQ